MALRSRFPVAVDAVTAPLGRGLGRTGVSPNVLTTLGLLLTAAAAGLVAVQRFHLAALLLILGGLMDVLDGSVARATERSTPFGGFYDSVSDRISDGLILGGIAWAVRDQPRLLALALVALVAASLTSYVRAKAEAIDLDCSVGVLERAERALLIIAALLFHPWVFEAILWLLTLGGVVTVVQRIHHVWCQMDRDVPDELLALALHDHAWSRAFKKAARRFYGEHNFDGAVDGHLGQVDELAARHRSAAEAGDREALEAGDREALDAGDREAVDAGDREAVDAGRREPDPGPTS